MKLHENQLNLIRHLIRFNLMAYEDCLSFLDTEKTGNKIALSYFEKAFVLIRIQTPRGTNNKQVWDTSNRAINVVINNLKGIFFDDDDFEHMACGIVADWGEIGQTEIRICALEELEKHKIFH